MRNLVAILTLFSLQLVEGQVPGFGKCPAIPVKEDFKLDLFKASMD